MKYDPLAALFAAFERNQMPQPMPPDVAESKGTDGAAIPQPPHTDRTGEIIRQHFAEYENKENGEICW